MIASPPRRPDFTEESEQDQLEALIREARRRARRRRLLIAGGAFFLGAAVVAGYLGFGRGGGGSTSASAGPSGPAASSGSRSVLPHNGGLALIALPETAPGREVQGWYFASTIGRDGRLHPLVRCPHQARWCGEVGGMAWSPDGTQLAISVTSIVLANPYNGFHVVDIRSGRDRQIFRCNACLWQDLDWSPDGRTIAGVDDGRIIFIDAKSAKTRYLWTNAALPNSSPSWSPDGRLIAFAAGVGRHAAVYVTDRTGHQLRRLAAGSDPSWSPRGGAIAYRAKCGVRLVSPTGRDVTPSTPFVCNAIRVFGAPVWSPDGRRIAVSGASNYGTGSAVRGTWVMRANGSALKLVSGAVGATFGGIPRPAWRPRP